MYEVKQKNQKKPKFFFIKTLWFWTFIIIVILLFILFIVSIMQKWDFISFLSLFFSVTATGLLFTYTWENNKKRNLKDKIYEETSNKKKKYRILPK